MTRLPRIDGLRAECYEVPTDAPESDGTLQWSSTTCVVAYARSGAMEGMGFTYSHAAAAALVRGTLAEALIGADATAPEASWTPMLRSVRNLGRQGIAAHAISAVDVALWDLKARLADTSLAEAWGTVRETVPVYGSGGFTSYDERQLHEQLSGWRRRGVQWAKIKVGRHPASDVQRVRVAREALGPGVELFVDANGAYTPKQALAFAEAFADLDVTWLEEPVSSDDLEGLRRVRFRAPAGMVVTAGEYGYHPIDLRKLLDAGAVDVLQADVTRCLGFTGLHKVAAECESRGVPLSTHGAPALSAHAGACLTPIVHVEHFHDHVRLEDRLFRGVPEVRDGALCVNRGAPGHGLSLDTEAASLFALDA